MSTKDGGLMWIDENGRPHAVLTLRDWFAGQALAGFINGCIERGIAWTPSEVAGESYGLADAMLAARSKQEGSGDE